MGGKLFFTVFVLLLSLFEIDYFGILKHIECQSLTTVNNQISKNLLQIQNKISKYIPINLGIKKLEIQSLSMRKSNTSDNYVMQMNLNFQFFFKAKITTKLVDFEVLYNKLITIRSFSIHFNFRNNKFRICGFEIEGDFGFDNSNQLITAILNRFVGTEFAANTDHSNDFSYS